MRKLLFLAFIAFALCGCGDSLGALDNTTDKTDETRKDENKDDNVEVPAEETGMWESSFFVTEFVVPSKIEVARNAGQHWLKITGVEYITYLRDKTSQSYKKAMEFAEFYSDTSYTGGIYPGLNRALAYPIEDITIYCEKDFDVEHPAGEPLDDVVKLEFKSFYEFIKNGYKYPENIPLGTSDKEGGIDYKLCLGDIDASLATLVHIHPFRSQLGGTTPLIHFASQPAEPGEYTFTLEMTTNGETLKTEFTHTFE